MTWLRRLFRRCPPHLRGRVPVECGVGTTTLRMFDDFGVVGWDHPIDSAGRAFLASLPRRPLDSAIHKAGMAVAKGEREACLTVDEYRAVLSYLYPSATMDGSDLVLFGVRLVLHRPSPAENARRYTSEEETW